MNRHSSFRIFSMLFGVIYTACFYYNWAPFRYYPQLRAFHLSSQGPAAGPAVLWYGWVVASAVASAAIAAVVPRQVADRLWHGWSWVVPAALIVGILVYEKRWFL